MTFDEDPAEDLSKIKAGHVPLEHVPFDLATVLTETVALMMPCARERRLVLSSSIAAGLPTPMHGDPDRVRQIALNLVGNAIDFTERGVVAVTADQTDAGTVRVRVADTGIGIDAAALPTLFQRFPQADAAATRRAGGTGRGLATCKRLVELMGGTMGVDSRPGEGSTFWFTLPVHLAQPAADPSPAIAASAAAAEEPPFDGPPLRVLIAEDNAANQILAAMMLTSLGCVVEVARNGREAVAKFEAAAYDIIFMDYFMPEMDGVEAAREIRRREAKRGSGSKRVPIVACTASVMASERDACLEAGMDDFLSKPLVKSELRHCLEIRTGAGAGPRLVPGSSSGLA